jgi:hypothetical protein
MIICIYRDAGGSRRTFSAGVAGLCHIDWVNKSAEISIYIGPKNWRRKGIGSLVLGTLKDIGFRSMGFHRLWAEVYDLPGCIMGSFLEKNGFRLDGKVRDTVYRDNFWHDSCFYSLLRDEVSFYKGDPDGCSLRTGFGT